MAIKDTGKIKWYSPLLIGIIIIAALILLRDSIKTIAKYALLIWNRTAHN